MKEIFLVLLFLVPFSSSSSIVEEIKIGQYEKELPVSDSAGYFYMTGEVSKADDWYVYLYLKAVSYPLTYLSFYYPPENPSAIGYTIEQSKFSPLYADWYETKSGTTEYYYKIPLRVNSFILVRYAGLRQEGKLYVKSSYSEIYKIKLSGTAIALIVVGVALVLIIAAFIIYCVCKPKVTVGGGNFSPSTQPAVGVSNSSFPLMENNRAIN